MLKLQNHGKVNRINMLNCRKIAKFTQSWHSYRIAEFWHNHKMAQDYKFMASLQNSSDMMEHAKITEL